MRKTVHCEAVIPRVLPTAKPAIIKLKTKIIVDGPEFIPMYQHEDDACCDLKANLPNKESIILSPMETIKIDVGFKMQLPVGYEAQIRCRSGMGSKGIIVTNSPGTIDNYRGKICVLLTNLSNKPFVINHLDKVAQMSLKPIYHFDFESTETLNESLRGENGFGSSG